MSDRIEFNAADKQTAAWDKMQRYWEGELTKLRAMNDKTMSEVETARLRGRIEQIKLFLGLDKPLPVVERQTFDKF